MKVCRNCFMTETKPGVILDEKGICQACNHYELRKKTDYYQRFEELKKLADKYRRDDGTNDCIVTVSGGKDSHYQVYILKEILGLNPLLISIVDPFTHTHAGEHNFHNIGDAFNCDILALHQSPALIRKMMKIAFEEMGSPTWPVDRAIYAFPIKMAIKLGIQLVVYGENVSWEYGGVLKEETYSAKNQIRNDVVKETGWDFWFKRGVSEKEIEMLKYPSEKEIGSAGIDPIYLSYFIPWDGYRNYQIAKRYGFRDIEHEWKREGFIENYDQVDSYAYLVHPWLRYPKFGYSRAVDVVGYWIRSGKITRKDGLDLIRKNNNKPVDQKALDDFLGFTGYTDREFWEIVEKFWNRDIFEKVNDQWVLKHNPWMEDIL